MNELKNRGISDLLIAVVDGLKGFPEAITAVFPQTIVQTCIIHLIRHSMDFASWKDRKVLAGVLKTIYRAKDGDAARAALEAFDASQWGQKYPAIAQSWRRNWERVLIRPGHRKVHQALDAEARQPASSACASAISAISGVDARPSRAGARTAWASVARAADWYSLASDNAARRPKLGAPCSRATAIAVRKASSAAGALPGRRFRRISPRMRWVSASYQRSPVRSDKART
jgi:mutator family transposase